MRNERGSLVIGCTNVATHSYTWPTKRFACEGHARSVQRLADKLRVNIDMKELFVA